MPVPSLGGSTITYCSGDNGTSSSSASKESPPLKIGVKLGVSGISDWAPQFFELGSKTGLMFMIKELASQWKLPEPPEVYALKYEGGVYVTEGNRGRGIVNGSVLILTHTPARIVESLIEKLNLYSGLEEFEELSPDPSFICEIVKIKGQEKILSLVTDNLLPKNNVGSLLNGIYRMMTKDRDWWENASIFDKDVLLRLASYLTLPLITGAEEKILVSAFKIFQILIPSDYEAVFSVLSVPEILRFLRIDNLAVQRLSIAVINALFEHGDQVARKSIKKEMETEGARQAIVTCIINVPEKHTKEMKRELYILQTLLLNQLKERMMTPVQSQDQKALEKIKELRKRAFSATTTDTPNTQPRAHRYNLDYKKLGFRNDVDPTQDFRETPPGTLALDLMFSFCSHHVEMYRKLVLENSCRGDEHDCPFAAVSIELVKLIVDIIRIGQEPLMDQDQYYPMFFTHDNPLEEFFSICILHLNKTWKEMRATFEDFQKVMDVTREQINCSLQHAPSTLKEFCSRLKSYAEIQELWKEEAKIRGEREGKAIRELKKVLLPDVNNLVMRNRLNFIVEGTRFPKYKEKGRFIFVKLSPNRKMLCHGEWNDDSRTPTVDDLDSKIPVSELKALLVGPEVSFTGRSKNRENSEASLAFSVLTESGMSLDLIAPSQKAFDHWSDAINALLQKPMISSEAKSDTESLLSMEIKLKLLDVEGLDIPEDPPEIPPSPPDYEFFGLEQ